MRAIDGEEAPDGAIGYKLCSEERTAVERVRDAAAAHLVTIHQVGRDQEAFMAFAVRSLMPQLRAA